MMEEKIIEKGQAREVEIEDPIVSASFLVQGLEVTAFLKTPSRVAFKIRGDIDRATENIQNNFAVPILDFGSAIKRLRSQIFFLKMSSHSLEKVR